MTIGQLCLFLSIPVMFYIGLTCLVIGVGFFKPNVPSILSEMFKEHADKKDSAYTIFYMGVNSGSFFGTMLCGYLAMTHGWSWGFGLAGIFMALGTIQFVFAKNLMGDLGVLKQALPQQKEEKQATEVKKEDTDKRNPFTFTDTILITIVTLLGLTYAFNDPLSKNGMYDVFAWANSSLMRGQTLFIIITLVLFIYVLFSRIMRYEGVVRSRMLAVVSLAIFIMFFYITFDQAPSSLIIIARDHVDRSLTGNGLFIFNIINSLIVVVPLIIIFYVLIRLAMATWKHIPITNMILLLCFSLIWVVVVYMLKSEFAKTESEISVSWFSVLNPFFVITLASSVSKIWESKFNPPAAYKYGFGLFFVAIGYIAIWLGATGLGEGGEDLCNIPYPYLSIPYFRRIIYLSGGTFLCFQVSTSQNACLHVRYVVLRNCYCSKDSCNLRWTDRVCQAKLWIKYFLPYFCSHSRRSRNIGNSSAPYDQKTYAWSEIKLAFLEGK